MTTERLTPRRIIDFWTAVGRDKWYTRDDALDAAITEQFGAAHAAAAQGELADWEASSDGALALLLLLDQFPRNMFRGSARAFATDGAARALADRAIARGFDTSCDPILRRFFYLPFMHSEALADQQRCIALCRADGDEEGVKYAVMHRDIIANFGRFPHRNSVLGRAMTEAEIAYLSDGGFSG